MQFWLPVTKFGTTPVPTNALFSRTVFATFGSVEMSQEMLSQCLMPLVCMIQVTHWRECNSALSPLPVLEDSVQERFGGIMSKKEKPTSVTICVMDGGKTPAEDWSAGQVTETQPLLP